ncbi:hypothetical protein GCM10007320_42940 [Pseudorhodoferax aquiterrae]|uniref:Uncharacterized protein n=1 Tax=Pseudorhodoferax aquiterrae TaxID=747304 RepID=A0ABQ3G645_9BURK|nr:hypothetical protein GCM10007320_42940 [Pseudorhodoferax aquiterrae]
MFVALGASPFGPGRARPHAGVAVLARARARAAARAYACGPPRPVVGAIGSFTRSERLTYTSSLRTKDSRPLTMRASCGPISCSSSSRGNLLA